MFTLPEWLRTWWQFFGSDAELYVRSVRLGDQVLGVAPLQIRGRVASIIGSINVCDYQDFIWKPGAEEEFCSSILQDLASRGVERLELDPVRPDSQIVSSLIPLARSKGYATSSAFSDISMDMELPATFEDYLEGLEGKQRHEIRRKMRNIGSIGDIRYVVYAGRDEIAKAINTFLQLFPEYRRDKAEFLTSHMQEYFRGLAANLADSGPLAIGSLESGDRTLAMIMYFDYNNNIYLYNSAYDPDFKNMSVGIISKVFCVRDSIEKGHKRFDFLKGNEQYKYYLGGSEIPLSKWVIKLA